MGVIQKFSRLIAIQKQRYRTKGSINIVIAGTLFLSIIWIANTIGKQKWPEHIQNEKTFAFIGSVFAHSFMQTVVFLLFLPGYLNLSAYYQKYRINKKTQKNWDRNNWPEMKTKLIKNVIINQFIIYPLFVFANKNRFRFRFHDFPTFEEMVWQIIVIYLIQDFFFYWGHRAFHSFTALYKMHKVHHQFDQLFTWITQYFHPIDFVVANILPSALGVMSLGANLHCFTYFYWICWKVLISFEGHSGYEFPWSPMRVLPLVTGPSYHDHHHSNNVGNFAGSCYLWDLIFNTNDEYMNRFLAIKVDQQKQD